ncbi:MAG: N-acetyltransferase family protein [Victivallaceae bacterium]|nr:hypothetical protein [Victivallaceae bacterium]
MKSNFTIVPSRDAELIGKLAAQIWPGVYGNILTPEQLAYMLDFISNKARNEGYKVLLLNVNRSNTNSVSAYLACGFSRWQTVDVPIGGGFFMNDYIMRKSL